MEFSRLENSLSINQAQYVAHLLVLDSAAPGLVFINKMLYVRSTECQGANSLGLWDGKLSLGFPVGLGCWRDSFLCCLKMELISMRSNFIKSVMSPKLKRATLYLSGVAAPMEVSGLI